VEQPSCGGGEIVIAAISLWLIAVLVFVLVDVFVVVLVLCALVIAGRADRALGYDDPTELAGISEDFPRDATGEGSTRWGAENQHDASERD